jgi:hypothetical protein
LVICDCDPGAVRFPTLSVARRPQHAGPLVIVGRVHVNRQSSVRVERSHLIEADVAHLKLAERIRDAQSAGIDCPDQFAVGSWQWASPPRARPAGCRLPSAVTLPENAAHD